MTGYDPSAQMAADESHHALLGLHATAGTFYGKRPKTGLRPDQTGEGLATLAEASTDQVSFGTRLDVLHSLAKADFPGYEQHEAQYLRLAESIGAPFGLDPNTVLDDVKQSVQEDKPFGDTATAQVLPHEATAFVGQDVCTTQRVLVDGKKATWVFSEFETDAPFETLAGWVDPHNWPKRSPLMFKKMDLIGRAPIDLSDLPAPPGLPIAQHWEGKFLEEVQLVERLDTVLHCNYFAQPGTAVGMTYELDHSVDHQIVVDRGFLLATDIGDGKHRVKALKIVGFTEGGWDTVALFVCPLWTEFVRQAAVGGTKTTPHDPTQTPPQDGSPQTPGGDVVDDWIDFLGDAAKTYAHLVADVASNAISGGYKPRDAVSDTARYWTQLAQDWSKAWAHGMRLVQDMAEDGSWGFGPPGGPAQNSGAPMSTTTTGTAVTAGEAGAARAAAAATAATEAAAAGTTATEAAAAGAAPAGDAVAVAGVESVIIPTPGLGSDAVVSCSDLRCIAAGAVAIPAAQITPTMTTVAGGKVAAVRVSVRTTDRPPGLYVGGLTVRGGPGIPIQFFVSGAVNGS